jgi:hypothetical protein
MNPTQALLCCRCSVLRDAQLLAAYPDAVIAATPVPDLARMGVFN